MLRDKLQRVTPPLELVSQFSEKEPITIRHNQNVADRSQNKLRTSDILTATCNIFFRQKLYCKMQGQITSDLSFIFFSVHLYYFCIHYYFA